MTLTSGSSTDAISTQTSHLVNSLNHDVRQEILKSFQTTVSIPAEHVAAMKSTLNLAWNKTRDIQRWFKTFGVELESEGKTRKVVRKWVGPGNCVEEVPA